MRYVPFFVVVLASAGCALSHQRPAASTEDAGPVSVDDSGPLDAGPPDGGRDASPEDAGWDAEAPEACPPDCEDGNPCTIDRCEGVRCVHRPDPESCELFVQHTIDEVRGAHSVMAADLDADGDLDLALASHRGRQYSWAENAGGTPLEWRNHVVHTGDVARRVLPVDLDSDGDLDLVGGGGNDDPHPIRWFVNESGDASRFGVRSIGDRELQDLDAGDVDGDGDVDVVAVSQWDTSEVVLLRNDGGVFSAETIAPDIGSHPQYVELRDLNLDGRLDVLAASFGLLWLEQLPDGAFVERELDFPATTSADPVDMDGDGDLDLLAVSARGDAGWLENLDGVFGETARHDIGDGFEYAWSIAGADMDGNGHVDALVAARDSGQFVLMLNQGGDRWERLVLADSMRDAFDIIAVDLDGDGDMDAVGAAMGPRLFVWWENRGLL